MATEGPYLAHTQCTAGANMSSSAALDGPNGSGQFLLVKISAARTVIPCAANSDLPHGVLQNDPISGAAANVAFSGVSKVVAGASFSAGAMLMSDSAGRAITQTSTNPVVGQAIEAASAANQVITMLIAPSIGAPG